MLLINVLYKYIYTVIEFKYKGFEIFEIVRVLEKSHGAQPRLRIGKDLEARAHDSSK